MLTGVIAAWREVKAIIGVLAGATLLALWAQKRGFALFSAFLLGWVFYFFRDPERIPGSENTLDILSPADGRVTAIEQVNEPEFIHGPAWRISIFLSLFDVHVQRNPYAGVIQFLRYQPGDFTPAFLKDTHSNEANLIGLETVQGPLLVKQIAGILARRIVWWVKVEDELAIGQRLGLIKFGSRVDLFLPSTAQVLVQVGQQVYGGQTTVACW